jgi:hypothetical protein
MLRSLLRAFVASLSLLVADAVRAAPSLNHDVTPETIASTIFVSANSRPRSFECRRV